MPSARSDEAKNKTFKAVLDDIINDIRGGGTFSDAVAAHGDIFPKYYVGMLQSAELSGNLDVVLEQISQYMERDIEAKRKVKSALAYPAIILVMAIGTILVLALFVLPRFETFFASLDTTLPLATAHATLHVRVLRGPDRHHVVEAAFKALGWPARCAHRLRYGVQHQGRVRW